MKILLHVDVNVHVRFLNLSNSQILQQIQVESDWRDVAELNAKALIVVVRKYLNIHKLIFKVPFFFSLTKSDKYAFIEAFHYTM